MLTTSQQGKYVASKMRPSSHSADPIDKKTDLIICPMQWYSNGTDKNLVLILVVPYV